MRDIFGDDDSSGSQDDFGKMLAQSMSGAGKSFEKGDKVTGEVVSIGKTEVFFSLGSSLEGVAPRTEMLDETGAVKVKIGDQLELYVMRMNEGLILLSTKPSNKALSESLEDAFDFGQSVEGRVTEVVNGGFRVQVFHKTAFCPISQMDSKPIQDQTEYLNKKFDFVITKFEGGGRNIVVSRRRLLEQQKEENLGLFLGEKKPGDMVTGQITRLESYGAFVELAPGLEGLCHISEVSWSHLAHPSEAVVVGQKVSVKILKLEDFGGHAKISLSIKQAESDPWATVDAHFEAGQVVTGKVTKCLNFGAFVEIHPGIEGLIPMGEMSYTKRVVKSDDLVKPGQMVNVLIKNINSIDKKMSLSLRDADGDPWILAASKFPVGKVANGKITRKEQYGVFVELEPGVVGLMPKSQTRDAVDYNIEHKKIGDEVTVQVFEVNAADRKLTLCPPNGNDSNWQANLTQTKTSFGTFGDLLQASIKKKN